MHAEYKQYTLKNFSPNFNRLKKTLQGLQDRADEDEAAFVHDEALNLRANNKPYPRWGGTVAERLLKIDIDAGKNETMKPRASNATRLLTVSSESVPRPRPAGAPCPLREFVLVGS
jgi:hypothetical protein